MATPLLKKASNSGLHKGQGSTGRARTGGRHRDFNEAQMHTILPPHNTALQRSRGCGAGNGVRQPTYTVCTSHQSASQNGEGPHSARPTALYMSTAHDNQSHVHRVPLCHCSSIAKLSLRVSRRAVEHPGTVFEGDGVLWRAGGRGVVGLERRCGAVQE